MSDQITVVITTSPVPSNPDTTMIVNVIKSINECLGLSQCRKLIYCDGYKVSDKFQLKQGKVPLTMIENYEKFMNHLELLHLENTEIIRRDKRYGFAANVEHALYQVTTPLVLVAQHDHDCRRVVNLEPLITSMMDSNLHYVTLMFSSLKTLATRLNFNQVMLNENLDKYGVPLIPLPFWYDRLHLANVEYYKSIFKNHKIKNFVEDTFGQVIKNDFKENGHDALMKYKTFVYVDTGKITDLKDDHFMVTRHIGGRTRMACIKSNR